MSGKRSVVLAENEYYHIFNRTTANEQVFVNKRDILRALNLISFYRYEQGLRFSFFDRLRDEEKQVYLKKLEGRTPIVEIHAFSLMPNHFHLLLRQNSNKGIQIFLSNFQNGFAKYFNLKNKRYGTLFQRPFKAKHIANDNELLHISRYIHLNPVTSYLIDFVDLKDSNLTSFPSYLTQGKNFVSTELITKLVGSVSKYEKFVENQVDYQRKINKIRHLLLD